MFRLLTQSAMLTAFIVALSKLINSLLFNLQKFNIGKDWLMLIIVIVLLTIISMGLVIMPIRRKN